MKGSRSRAPLAVAKEGNEVREAHDERPNNSGVDGVLATPDEVLSTHKCHHCGKKFHFHSTLVSHLKTHHSVPMTCPVCSRTFGSYEFHDHHLQCHPGWPAAATSASGANNMYSPWSVYQGQAQMYYPVPTIPFQAVPNPRLPTRFSGSNGQMGTRRRARVHYSRSVALSSSTSAGVLKMRWTETQEQVIAVAGHYSGMVPASHSLPPPFQVRYCSSVTTVTMPGVHPPPAEPLIPNQYPWDPNFQTYYK